MVNKITSPVTPLEVVNKINELVDDKQDTLVSGTNIKTVGGTSLLGSGNVSLPTGNDLFDNKWSDHQIDDQSWLRADTFSWQDGTVYTDAYNHLVDDIDGKTATSETVGSYTISYYLADDGHKITTDETTVANIYNESGVAWYYVLDTVNTRFKLPRTKYGFVGLRDSVGKFVEAGLPNITGTFRAVDTAGLGLNASGAIYLTSSYDNGGYGGGGGRPNSRADLGFDASKSSSIYGNSTTVQPPATQMYLYFYVGQFSQTATEQTAGLNAGLFNGKADVDLSNAAPNASASAKETIVGWGMPDYTAGVNKGWASFTAESKGWLYCYAQVASQRVYVYVNGAEVYSVYNNQYADGKGELFPIDEGDIVTISGTTYQTAYMIFYPCKGL